MPSPKMSIQTDILLFKSPMKLEVPQRPFVNLTLSPYPELLQSSHCIFSRAIFPEHDTLWEYTTFGICSSRENLD